MPHSRREFFKCGLGFGLGGVSSSTLPATASAEEQERTPSLSLMDYQPRSMLVTEQHAVERARFPAIDMHTHVSSVFRSTPVPGHPLQGSPAERLEQIVRWMDELTIETLVDLTGGTGEQLRQTVDQVVKRHPGRIVTCTVPSYRKLGEPDYASWQADAGGSSVCVE